MTSDSITFQADRFGAFRATAPNGVAVWVVKRGRSFSYGTGTAATSRERGQAANLEAAKAAAIESTTQP